MIESSSIKEQDTQPVSLPGNGDCWAVSDGRAGIEIQTVSLIMAFGEEPDRLHLEMRRPWRWLPPAFIPRFSGMEKLVYKNAARDRLQQLKEGRAEPKLIVGCGRQAALFGVFARRIARLKGLSTKVVQVQDPKIPPALYDFVVTPQHDRLRGKNVLITEGGLNTVTPERLSAAAQELSGRISHLPTPLVSVLIGGKSKAHDLSAKDLEKLLATLEKWHRSSGCSFLVTPSRRTPHDLKAMIRKQLAGIPHFYWDGEKSEAEGGSGEGGPNPYLGYLAVAEHIVATEDSVNMVTEAASTGKPVWIAGVSGGSAKFSRFHQSLREKSFTRPLADTPEDWRSTPLQEALRIARELARRFEKQAS
ncbi:mitochondrial fission ELM1 family protein [Kiloniella sp. b19]|uniref:mitochondrial fission ELM1 family protein n=1 Tax=Kiloniella sp. GXU_MW_B19 TaxID=3141326 RepID=UPI0031E36E32